MRLGTEDKIQLAILEYLEAVLPNAFVHHSPNGGRRSITEGRRFKMLGVVAGFPDLILCPGNGRTYLLEIKSPTGRVSPEQRDVMDRLHHLGVEGAVVRSVDDVRLALKAWNLTTREAA